MTDETTAETLERFEAGEVIGAEAPPNFTCQQCGRSFNSQGALGVHSRSHDGKKPCPECGDMYQPGPGMSRHRQALHGVAKANGDAPKKGGAPLKKQSKICPECHKTLRADNLTRHLHNVHGIGTAPLKSVLEADLSVDDVFNGVVGMLFPSGVIPVDVLPALLRWRHATDILLDEVG